MEYSIVENNVVTNVVVAEAPLAMNWHEGNHGVGSSYAELTGLFERPVAASAPLTPISRILTHLQFRRLFTPAEQEMCDELEVTFEANATLSAAQKRGLRTGYKNFYAASEVNLDDPAIPPMLGLYEALGLIDAGRAAEILN